MSSATSSGNTILVETVNGKEQKIPFDLLQSVVGVDTVVRLADAEYPSYLQEGDVFTHFNLGSCLQIKGISYVLARILRHGQYADRDSQKDSQSPLLGFRDVRLAICEDVGHLSSYDDIADVHLRNSFPHLRTKEDIANIIVQRYQASMSKKNRAEILSEGLVYAHFRVTGRVNYILQDGVFVSSQS